jgi:hypothetical protein
MPAEQKIFVVNDLLNIIGARLRKFVVEPRG